MKVYCYKELLNLFLTALYNFRERLSINFFLLGNNYSIQLFFNRTYFKKYKTTSYENLNPVCNFITSTFFI